MPRDAAPLDPWAARAVRAVRALLRAHLPDVPAATIVPLGSGLDHGTFLVDGTLVVRLPLAHDDDGAPDGSAAGAHGGDLADVEREARLLRLLAGALPVAVPEPVLVDPGRGALAYPLLPGRPLLDLPEVARARATAVGARLGAVLAVLHAVPADDVAGLVAHDATALEEWLADAAEHHAAVAGHLAGHVRPAVRAFLDAPPPSAGQPVLSHNDLGIEHVLVDAGGHVTGLIDWSDAALVDPARDLGLVLRDLGPAALDTALTASGHEDRGLPERALFYARCGALEDLAYGLEAGRGAYAAKSITALAWLFPG
ncbi:phosphotransferase [Georgenia sp. MJ206]|uniref:phosphotransferase family protein n=1 Tax=Georgenia wangjunii TaxID=3117730 RepID=UPI002F263CB4